MPSRNPKFRTKEIVTWNEQLGVEQPEVEFYKDPACSVRQDWQFPLTDRGSISELAFYLKSPRTLFDVRLKAQAEPDPKWPEKKSAMGPMHLQVEPSEVQELKAGHVLAGKLIWNVPDDEPTGKRQASVLLTARFTE